MQERIASFELRRIWKNGITLYSDQKNWLLNSKKFGMKMV